MTYDPKSDQKHEEIPEAAQAPKAPQAAPAPRTGQTGHTARTGQERAVMTPEAREVRELREEPGTSETAGTTETGGTSGTAGTKGTAETKGTGGTREAVKPLHTRQSHDTHEVREPAMPTRAPDAVPGGTADKARATTPGTTAGKASGKAPGHATDGANPRLFPQDESDKLTLRLQEALNTFVDGPRRSVEEAAGVLEEAAERLTSALAERPRSLRASWDGTSAGDKNRSADGSDTEDLRLALQSYREVTERLLRI
ncbi:hypothetical protein ACFWM0_13460 [Streptomyces sp. NPDC058405]|uniref:hypothetical protein n=1 Tax=Streptomyces sp. NPDC058405 TaxID=3346482 RepID=UPI00364D1DAA